MKTRVITTGITVALALAAVAPAPLRAQDAALVDREHCKVLVDNAHVRVLEFTLPPGAKDPVHTHPAGVYTVTSPGKMRVTPVGGKAFVWESKANETAWMDAEGAHGSENIGATPISFVLVEVKGARATGGAQSGK